MENPRLVQLSLVICAASLALSGCGSTLVSGDLHSSSAPAGTALAPLGLGPPIKSVDLNRWKSMRRFMKPWSRDRKRRAR